uniref:Uncharacterized protein n=1 Tax=Chromera velia CCMP2878 TaxID=1169474 RepID=A0A0G4FYB1_9ALVE|eukprot:Cvel_19345.t1-p1 / transcript=Cvel_19345.t1 / gene=Cvel_19345 / organism=Chromera_velia_CCMP2878 / gene_product=hypothetical protein / transcript_product=hypothetical protein / location=Cvel_scaffold1661:10517-12938(+) / protein_length=494 / sequence_SO=supercontig / SO=protein_coding / is_pseudo=false
MLLSAFLVVLCAVGATSSASDQCRPTPESVCASLYAGRSTLSSPCQDSSSSCQETFTRIRTDFPTWQVANQLLAQKEINDKEKCTRLEKPGSSSGSNFCASSFMNGMGTYKRCADCQQIFEHMQPAETHSPCDPNACGENFNLCLNINSKILQKSRWTPLTSDKCVEFVNSLRKDKDVVNDLFIPEDTNTLKAGCDVVRRYSQEHTTAAMYWEKLLGGETETDETRRKNPATVLSPSVLALSQRLHGGLDALMTSPSYLHMLIESNPEYLEKFLNMPSLVKALDAATRLHSAQDLRGVVAATHTAELWTAVKNREISLAESAKDLESSCYQFKGVSGKELKGALSAISSAAQAYTEPEENIRNDRGAAQEKGEQVVTFLQRWFEQKKKEEDKSAAEIGKLINEELTELKGQLTDLSQVVIAFNDSENPHASVWSSSLASLRSLPETLSKVLVGWFDQIAQAYPQETPSVITEELPKMKETVALLEADLAVVGTN